MFFITVMMIPRNSGVDACISQPRFLENVESNICQTCGEKGDLKRLVYCVQCQVSAEHSYCIEKLHKEDDGTISWTCGECSLKDAKCGSEQLRKSGRIGQATKAKHNRDSTSLREKKSVVLEQALMSKSFGADSSNCLEKYDIYNGNQDLPIKKRRRLDLKDEDILCEESESLEGLSNTPSDQPTLDSEKYVHAKSFDNHTIDESESMMLQQFLYSGRNKYSLAEPVSSPAWRGQFRINNTTLLGLVAHLSSIACSKVHCTVTALPPQLDVELLSRFDIWPESFQMSPPADDNIGLYIFPQYESDEKDFDCLMNDLIEQNLALKAIITRDVELLIFSSRVLAPEYWRLCRKYFLWGVFRQKRTIEDTQSN